MISNILNKSKIFISNYFSNCISKKNKTTIQLADYNYISLEYFNF